MSAILRRNLLATRPTMARAMSTSMRTLKSEAPAVANASASQKRDLVAEQVDRIGNPAPVSIVSDAPSTYVSY